MSLGIVSLPPALEEQHLRSRYAADRVLIEADWLYDVEGVEVVRRCSKAAHRSKEPRSDQQRRWIQSPMSSDLAARVVRGRICDTVAIVLIPRKARPRRCSSLTALLLGCDLMLANWRGQISFD